MLASVPDRSGKKNLSASASLLLPCLVSDESRLVLQRILASTHPRFKKPDVPPLPTNLVVSLRVLLWVFPMLAYKRCTRVWLLPLEGLRRR